MQDPLAPTRPGPPHAMLRSLAGAWKVAATFRYGAGPEQRGEASCEARMVLDRFLEQRYQSKTGSETIQYVGYDNQRKVFFVFKVDNMDTGYLLTEGIAAPDAKMVSTQGTRTDPVTGARARVRIVLTVADDNHFRVEWYMPGADGPEQRVVLLEHVRTGLPEW